MKLITIIILLTITWLSSLAQVKITPGDKLINYSWVKPGHDFYRNQISDTTGKIVYDFVMENFITIDSAGRQITFARSRQIPAGSFSTDTSVTDLHFKPVRMHEIHYQRDVSFDMRFSDGQAVVKTTRKGTVTERKYPMSAGYFEDNMIEYIFGYQQLKKGVTYVMDNFNKDTASPFDPYTIEYAFADTWDMAPDHRIKCTVLHFTHGETSGYIWIDDATHSMIKTVADFKTGSYLLTKI